MVFPSPQAPSYDCPGTCSLRALQPGSLEDSCSSDLFGNPCPFMPSHACSSQCLLPPKLGGLHTVLLLRWSLQGVTRDFWLGGLHVGPIPGCLLVDSQSPFIPAPSAPDSSQATSHLWTCPSRTCLMNNNVKQVPRALASLVTRVATGLTVLQLERVQL